MPETFGDFWRMVWEQRSCGIVMMTKLEERNRVRARPLFLCRQYFIPAVHSGSGSANTPQRFFLFFLV